MIKKIKIDPLTQIDSQLKRLSENIQAAKVRFNSEKTQIELTVHADTESREETKELLDFLATLPNVGTISVDLYYGSKIDITTGKRANPHPYRQSPEEELSDNLRSWEKLI